MQLRLALDKAGVEMRPAGLFDRALMAASAGCACWAISASATRGIKLATARLEPQRKLAYTGVNSVAADIFPCSERRISRRSILQHRLPRNGHTCSRTTLVRSFHVFETGYPWSSTNRLIAGSRTGSGPAPGNAARCLCRQTAWPDCAQPARWSRFHRRDLKRDRRVAM